MDDALARVRFGGAPVAVLATVAADGSPRLVPVTFACAGDRGVIAVDHKPKTTRQLARLSDIERDPRVALLAQFYDADWAQLWWVRATGTAVVKDDEPAVTDAAALLAAKYHQYREHPPAGPIIDVAIETWRSWEAQPA
ncbi:MAG: TIGR03668 family PPOX class F420-dependent oxidoreductase [Acidimicrobiia bacterium]|nr:TIGR03668 family PPOX class F420-dependent oxidoreductase [Acidimicrobiia bacterium]